MIFSYSSLDPSALAERWWTLAVRGIAAILFGLITIVWPGISLIALTYVWGAYAAANGVLSIVFAARAGRAGERWGWLFFEGLLSIGAALVAVLMPGITQLALLTLVAFWAMFTGFVQIAAAIELRRVIRGEWLLALGGVLSIVFGGLLLWFPVPGALAVVTMIGVYSMLFGIALIALGLKVRRLAEPKRDHVAAQPSVKHA
jgi:uncharacterized membrane protein HdeD (DUF308 family)